MTYPTYAAMKDSGVAWLGDVPEHWDTRRLKFLIAKKITDGPHETPTFIGDGVPFLSVDGIQDGELVFNNCRYVSVEAHENYKRKALPQFGDILLGKAASTGKIARVKVGFEFSIWSPLVLIKPNTNVVDSTFLEYAFKCNFVQAQIDVLCTSNTQKNISMDDIPIIAFPFPPLPEQRAIAAFLDHKTAEIDDLIGLKERQIALLRQKRQALISHAVTRGLDPHAPMRDSGVAWLGDVPQGWEVTRVKFLATKIGSGKTPKGGATIYLNEGVIFLRSQNIYDDGLRLDEVVFISDQIDEEMNDTRVYPNDVLLNITGASIGRTAIVPDPFPKANVNQHVCIIRPSDEVHSQFLSYCLKSTLVKHQIESFENGSSREGLNFEQVGNLVVALPRDNMLEQLAIVEYLDAETGHIDAVVATIEDQVERLRVYRQALITDAVTGKIDVRNV